MDDAFSPDLFSDFRRTSSPRRGRGGSRRGRGIGRRGRGRGQRSADSSQDLVVVSPPDPTPSTKRKKLDSPITSKETPDSREENPYPNEEANVTSHFITNVLEYSKHFLLIIIQLYSVGDDLDVYMYKYLLSTKIKN